MATSSKFLNRATPGVYINEIEAFGSSIVGVATSVPIFIGYTQFAGDPQTGAPLYMKPVRISSMMEYLNYFGSAPPLGPTGLTFSLPTPPDPNAPAPPPPPPTPAPDTPPLPTGGGPVPLPSLYANYTTGTGTSAAVGSAAFAITATGSFFSLYYQMRLFFANGGNDCFIVSVGSYWANQAPTTSPTPGTDWATGTIIKGDPAANPPTGLLGGLAAAAFEAGPTMIVVPEACQLAGNDYAAVVQAMLLQAAELQDRVALLDLPNCLTADTINDLVAAQDMFANAIAAQIANASYGVAYAPALATSVVAPTDVSYLAVAASAAAGNVTINNVLTTQATRLYGGDEGKLATVQSMIAAAFPAGGSATANAGPISSVTTNYTAEPEPTDEDYTPAKLAQWQSDLDKALTGALPVLLQIKTQVAAALNVAAPSGMMAGTWTRSDGLNGVWNAPANLALAGVVAPIYNMNDDQQAGFNLPLNGQAINVLRAQPGRGTVVWGARTLDGNSNDYRYVQVRRTLIYIEQSIKTALQSFVFAPNDSTTWMAVSSAISSFLTSLWRSGGLMGAKPDEAFTVQVGLGSTMTAQDVLNGYMVVAVTLQMIHPAEFIELTFTQMMNS